MFFYGTRINCLSAWIMLSCSLTTSTVHGSFFCLVSSSVPRAFRLWIPKRQYEHITVQVFKWNPQLSEELSASFISLHPYSNEVGIGILWRISIACKLERAELMVNFVRQKMTNTVRTGRTMFTFRRQRNHRLTIAIKVM